MVNILVRLTGDAEAEFKELKQALGINYDVEVVRYALKNCARPPKTKDGAT